MWIKAKDETLYNAERASRIKRRDNVVEIWDEDRRASPLISCKSIDEAQELMERLAEAIASQTPYFDVSKEPDRGGSSF
jgi:hypothetical protein